MAKRHTIFGPVVFGLAGAANGISYAMLNYYDAFSDRVEMKDSERPMLVGAFLGAILGFGMMFLYQKVARSRMWIEIGGVTILFAGIGGPIGFLAGERNIIQTTGCLYEGIVIGAILGLIVGPIQWFVDR